jgi:ribonuclease P protein component
LFLQSHRIQSKKERETLFTQGNSFVEYPFKFVWTCAPAPAFSAKLLVSVPKKRLRHAVDRNFVKRRIRETVRLFEKEHSAQLPHSELRVAVIFLSENALQCPQNYENLRKGLQKIFFPAVN